MRVLAAFLIAPLAALAAAPHRPVAPPVFFNHFYRVVDAETYAAAKASAFLREGFAPYEERTTVRNDASYTGIYWYGRHTYFELFEPGAQGPAGSSGLALSVDAPGASVLVKARWETAGLAPGGGDVTRATDGAEVPWFHITYATAPPSDLEVWLMEYASDFLARWHPALTAARSIRREDVLDRYAAKVGAAARRDELLLGDVEAVVLAVDPPTRDLLVKQLGAVGFEATADGVLRGGGVTLRLEPSAGPPRITSARFSLQREARGEHRIGTSVLRLEGRAATWSY